MRSKSYTLEYIAGFLSAELQGDKNVVVNSLASLDSATSEQLSFISNKRYRKQLASTTAGAVLLSPEDFHCFSGNAVVCDDPYLAYAQISQLFDSAELRAVGICDSASVHPSVVVAATAYIAEGARVAAGCVIADDVVIGANTVVGANCHVRKGTVIQANVTLYHNVSVGEGCLIHSGSVIGADGFGFAKSGDGWFKIAQLGGVVIGDNVEVGACTTIDRGALDDTIIDSGVILDNQIQIAHNVHVGKNTAIAACTAVAGSTRIGAQCTIAGACGITGHVTIADGTHITAMSIVTKSIVEAGVYSSGTGMMPNKQWKKNVVRFRQLDDLARRIKSIEDEIVEIKGS